LLQQQEAEIEEKRLKLNAERRIKQNKAAGVLKIATQ
jgi:hypothetical protein